MRGRDFGFQRGDFDRDRAVEGKRGPVVPVGASGGEFFVLMFIGVDEGFVALAVLDDDDAVLGGFKLCVSSGVDPDGGSGWPGVRKNKG